MNDLDVYYEAGYKAGQATRRGDAALAKFQREWASKAFHLEEGEYREKAKAAYAEGYDEAQPEHLRRKKNPRKRPPGTSGRASRFLENPFAKGVKKAVTRGRKVVRAVSGGLKKAQAIYRALHPGKALPASLASRKKRKQNPARKKSYGVFHPSEKLLKLKKTHTVYAVFRASGGGEIGYGFDRRFAVKEAKRLADITGQKLAVLKL